MQGEDTAENSLTKLQHSKHMADLLGNMLKKKYPNFNMKQFSIDDILEWKLWPGFMKIYGKYYRLHHITHYIFTVRQKALGTVGLSNQDQEICQQAMELFKITCSSLLDGSITMIELEKLQKNSEQVQKLYDAIIVGPDENQEAFQSDYLYDQIGKALKDRLEEYQAFMDHLKKLENILCLVDSDLDIQGKVHVI